MGKYDKEINTIFKYIEQLETTYYIPEDFSYLYNKLYEVTVPEMDTEIFSQKLAELLELDNIDVIKTKIRQLLEFDSCVIDCSKINMGVKIVEYLSMSIKHLAMQELSINNKVFVNMAYKKQIEKNIYYGDIWYKRGRIGVCRDMGRKIVRFKKFHSMVIENPKDATDNLIDLLNYCVFYMVLAEEEKNALQKNKGYI